MLLAGTSCGTQVSEVDALKLKGKLGPHTLCEAFLFIGASVAGIVAKCWDALLLVMRKPHQ